jgi:rifampicin phosphotransferase
VKLQTNLSRWIRWIDDRSTLQSSLVGNKASNLQYLRTSGFHVPDAFIVTVEAYGYFLECNGIDGELNSLLAELDLSGYEIVPIMSHVQELLRNSVFPENLREAILESYAILTEPLNDSVAVRSSAVSEDLPNASSAGIYDSKLNVDASSLLDSVRECWYSLHSLSAAYYRKKRGLPSTKAGMAVLVQKMVHPDEIGVLFTRDPIGMAEFLLEWNSCAGQSVTEGDIPTMRVRGNSEAVAISTPTWVHELVALGQRAERSLECPLDIEWARSNEHFYLLQARPITATQDCLEGFRIAQADNPVECRELKLRGCESLHARWWAKHQTVRRIAKREGIPIAQCLYAEYGAKSDLGLCSSSVLEHLKTPYLFVDASDKLRTIIIPRGDLAKHMGLLLGDDNSLTIRIRECFTGPVSLISGLFSGEQVLIEHTPGGIKGLIRGLSAADHYLVDKNGNIEMVNKRLTDDQYFFNDRTLAFERVLSEEGAEATASPGADNSILKQIERSTRILSNELGQLRLEWCVWNGVAYLTDYSLETTEASRHLSETLRVISSGAVAGTSLVMKGLEGLAYISDGNLISMHGIDAEISKSRKIRELASSIMAVSEKESIILVAERPYSALAVLIDKIDGFVFEDGAILSHLAILLREAQKPAVLYPNATKLITTGQRIRIDADGFIEISTHGA